MNLLAGSALPSRRCFLKERRMSYEDEPMDPDRNPGDPEGSRDAVADRVKLPAIFLIIVGVLNIFGALYFVVDGALIFANPDMVKKNMEEMNKAFNLPNQEVGVGAGAGIFYLALGVVALLAAALTILGGARMVALKSHGLAVTASVVAAIPCLSSMGCCCFGEAVGIWCLIVLMNADVRAAFR
jgi:hypothetical protein